MVAPRSLNAPIGCRLSAFNHRSPGAHGAGSKGVRTTYPAILSAAARTSEIVTSVTVISRDNHLIDGIDSQAQLLLYVLPRCDLIGAHECEGLRVDALKVTCPDHEGANQ
ncbi:hypothetical protein GCM10009556_081280 [Acrocarpospora pleiomorpha]